MYSNTNIAEGYAGLFLVAVLRSYTSFLCGFGFGSKNKIGSASGSSFYTKSKPKFHKYSAAAIFFISQMFQLLLIFTTHPRMFNIKLGTGAA
jgi:hypothetical protein